MCACATSTEPAPSPRPLSLPASGPCLCLLGTLQSELTTLSWTATWSRGSPRASAATALPRQLGRSLGAACADVRLQQQGWVLLAPQVGMGTGGRAPAPAPRPGEDPSGAAQGRDRDGLGPSAAISGASCQGGSVMRAPGSVYVQQAGAAPGDPLLAPHRRAPCLLGHGHWGPTHSRTWGTGQTGPV